MKLKTLAFAGLIAFVPFSAFAQNAPQVSNESVIQALGQMLQEAQGREAQANVRFYSAQTQIKTLTDQLAVEKKRADDAEAKLKAASK